MILVTQMLQCRIIVCLLSVLWFAPYALMLWCWALWFLLHRCYSAESLLVYFQFWGWIVVTHPIGVGRLYFPIFLFNVGLFTLIYMASFIALAILWSSLPIILKFSTDVMWPVLFWCSCMGDGAFRCSLYLSSKVLDDSPMYSSLQFNLVTSEPIYYIAFLLDVIFVF